MDINPFEVGGGREQQRGRFERRRRRAVALLRIEPFLERRLLSLSNGETQRAQLARALCHPLRLLILDEPFVGLDTAAREHFHHVLEHLMHSSLRVLLVTTRPEGTAPPSHPRAARRSLPGGRGWPPPRPPAQGGSPLLLGRRGLGRGGPRPGKAKPSPSSGSAPELVRLRQVTVRYGKTTILRDLDWCVRAGESWALLGPNGSGKTTLLSLILNEQAYVNQVEVFCRRRGTGESIWDIKRHIGWVSPELHLHFNDAASCLEVVASGFRDTVGLFEPPSSRQRRAAREYLAQFGMLDSAQAPLFSLSAGLQRMVLLARALVKRPKLLILDEPCQGLDAAHRALSSAPVDGLLRQGAVTAIYVTHRPDEIPPSIQRVLRLKRKRHNGS